MKGRRPEMPVGAVVTGVVGGTEPIVFTWVCGVVPPRPVSRGNRASALGPIAGANAEGATTGTGAAEEPNGSTVT